MDKIPEAIYLNIKDDDGDDVSEVLWSEEGINQYDVKYIKERKKIIIKLSKKALKEIEQMKKDLNLDKIPEIYCNPEPARTMMLIQRIDWLEDKISQSEKGTSK